jgi:YVTN family beta-propeller protein
MPGVKFPTEQVLDGKRRCAMTGTSSDTKTGVGFGLLGPLRATRSNEPLSLGGRQQKAVLARLLIERNSTVSMERLADALWGERVPDGWISTIQTYISHLREALEPDRPRGAPPQILLTENGGYRLRVEDAAIDAVLFEQRVSTGRGCLDAGRFVDAAAELSDALSLWRGGVLADLADYDFARETIARLDALRLAALEARVEADLALGRHHQLAAELDGLVAEHPLRERLHGQRMLALYRCGQQSEALNAYQRLRDTLAQELGIDPSPPLQKLYQSILRQDPELDWHPTTAPDQRRDEISAASVDVSSGARRRWTMLGAALTAAAAVVTVTAVVVSRSHLSTLSNLPANSVGRIDAKGAIRAAVTVGQSPDSVAYGSGSLWVANGSDRTVSRIDAQGHRVTQTIEVGASPSAITATNENVWVVNGGDGTVSRINTLSNKSSDTIRVGNLPSAIASGPSGVWVANSGDDTVQRIDPTTGKPGKPIDVGGSPAGIAVGDHTIWVTNGQDGTVSRIDAATGQPEGAIPVGAGPKGIAVTSKAVWVANSLELTVTRIDPATGRVVQVLEVGDGPHSVAATSDTVWVSNEYDGTITRIDPAANRVTRRIATGSSPRGLALIGSSLWVASGSFASPAHKGGTLTVVSAPIPGFDTIDPAKSWLPTVMALAYDGLVAQRHTGGAAGITLVPDLATTLPRPTNGGLTYTFTLRKGIRYSNGDEVQPEDIIRGLQRTLPYRGLHSAYYYYGIRGVRECAGHPAPCDLHGGVIADNATSKITFHLTERDPDFLYKLSTFVYATARGTPPGDITTPLPATGPYMISGFTKKDRKRQLTMVRNPNFRQWSFAAKPDGYPDVIRWRRVPATAAEEKSPTATAADQVADILAGRADLNDPYLAGMPIELASSLARQHPAQLHYDVGMSTFYMWFDTRVPPFNNKDARRALNYAVDREKLGRPVRREHQGRGKLSSPAAQLSRL